MLGGLVLGGRTVLEGTVASLGEHMKAAFFVEEVHTFVGLALVLGHTFVGPALVLGQCKSPSCSLVVGEEAYMLAGGPCRQSSGPVLMELHRLDLGGQCRLGQEQEGPSHRLA